ncbi:MAG: VWA domain-containing protein [Myxococcales bacterium]|nr:VWA domain-containing protein [Myxococcales bacterium]
MLTASLLTVIALLLALGVPARQKPVAPTPTPRIADQPGGKSGAVMMQSRLSGSHVLADGPGNVYLDIDLRADEAAKRRLPLNIALVIDRSGSMAGAKLRDAKKAAIALVERLTERDRLAVIDYGSDVFVRVASTPVTSAARQSIIASIQGIHDRGGTYLSGGLERGRAEIAHYVKRGQVNRVILISDGQANEGVTSPRALQRLSRTIASNGVSVTTMGVGLDFDEDVLTKMAEHGNGHYYFVKESSDMASIFSKELDIMMGIVGQRPQLHITLAPGVSLTRVLGYPVERRAGNVVVVSLPDIHSKQRRKLLAELVVPTGVTGPHAVARVELSFEDANTGKRRVIASTTSVTVTKDRGAVARGENREVVGRAQEARVATRLETAMRSFAGGDVAAAQAVLKKTIRATSTLNARLRRPALRRVVRDLKAQLRASESAAPATPAGRALIKRNKAKAYDLYR